jgi:lycopene cyclase domain-containing protein
MTYFGVLGLFLVPPVVVMATLAASKYRSAERLPYLAVLAMAIIAVVYTTPWDNYLVATNVWWYDRMLVNGLTLGWVPIEEYLFFILQTLLTGLLAAYLMGRAKPRESEFPGIMMRLRATAVTGLLWLLAVGLLLNGWAPGTYLALILTWALVPIMIQLAYGADILYAHRRLLLAVILLPTSYLWLVDFLAMRSGTWTIDPLQTLGIALGDTLVVEEMVFFLVTNILIGFGIVLLLSAASQSRARAIWPRLVSALRASSLLPNRDVGE